MKYFFGILVAILLCAYSTPTALGQTCPECGQKTLQRVEIVTTPVAAPVVARCVVATPVCAAPVVARCVVAAPVCAAHCVVITTRCAQQCYTTRRQNRR